MKQEKRRSGKSSVEGCAPVGTCDVSVVEVLTDSADALHFGEPSVTQQSVTGSRSCCRFGLWSDMQYKDTSEKVPDLQTLRL